MPTPPDFSPRRLFPKTSGTPDSSPPLSDYNSLVHGVHVGVALMVYAFVRTIFSTTFFIGMAGLGIYLFFRKEVEKCQEKVVRGTFEGMPISYVYTGEAPRCPEDRWWSFFTRVFVSS